MYHFISDIRNISYYIFIFININITFLTQKCKYSNRSQLIFFKIFITTVNSCIQKKKIFISKIMLCFCPKKSEYYIFYYFYFIIVIFATNFIKKKHFI